MKYGINLIFRFLITIVTTLIILILVKSNSNFKSFFYKKAYSDNLSFYYFENLYNKYIGSTNIINKVINTETVFSEKLEYKSMEPYLDGVRLQVETNYLVPITESGIVVFIGEKEGYGNTVIIQRNDGVDEWYGNITNINVNIYDYVSKGTLLGEANNVLYLVYKKEGNALNYEEYIN